MVVFGRRFSAATCLLVLLLFGALMPVSPAAADMQGWVEPVSMANPAAGWLASGCNGARDYPQGLYHIGRDYWSAVGTNVKAIGDGVIVANADFGTGFARALFIKHKAADGSEFVVLYGHVTSSLVVGTTVRAGDTIAQIAQLADGGSHLHFGLVPGAGYPSTNWGRLACDKWPATNSFVDPMAFLAAHNRIATTGASGQGPGVGMSAFKGSDQLVINQPLYQNQYVMSPDGQFVLLMQADQNLVLYGPGFKPVWGSNTVHSGAGYVVLQTDGNLVMYTPDGRTAVWSNGQAGSGAAKLVTQRDGNVVAYRADNATATWATNTSRFVWPITYKGTDTLAVNQALYQNQFLRSRSGVCFALLQADGSFVLYGPGYHIIGGAGPVASGAGYIVLQPDSNLVMYTPDGKTPLWGNGARGSWGTYVVLQNDCNLVEYTADNKAVWGSNTAGKI